MSSSQFAGSSTKLYSQLQTQAKHPSNKKRLARFGFVAGNFMLLAGIAAVVLHGSASTPTKPTTSSALFASSAAKQDQTNPLDQVSSADIALTVARMSSLPESTAITNQAQSQAVTAASVTADNTMAAKPQVVTTDLKSRADIETYTVAAGDTVTSLAQKFGITSDSIRWSNNLTGDAVNPGTKLSVPPVNGIVYTVAAGDTSDSLANKFKASKDKIVAFNDAEINGLVPGSRIVIPDGTQIVAGTTAAQIARTSATSATSASASFPWGGAPVYGYNGYDYGYCTWYVANRLPVPSNWGNANTWDNLAPASGWSVSTTPRVGAVAQSDRGYFGHVAVVEAVSDDGTMIKYSDMNGLAGFGRVGYSDWTSSSHFQHYIYR